MPDKCLFSSESAALRLTAREAKGLSLEIWEYLAGHPEIRGKEGLPEALFSRVEPMVLNCPLCEFFFQDDGLMSTCPRCPLVSCNTDGSLYLNWARSVCCDERKYNAKKILDAIRAWDAGYLDGA
jgi:hypothetical protein